MGTTHPSFFGKWDWDKERNIGWVLNWRYLCHNISLNCPLANAAFIFVFWLCHEQWENWSSVWSKIARRAKLKHLPQVSSDPPLYEYRIGTETLDLGRWANRSTRFVFPFNMCVLFSFICSKTKTSPWPAVTQFPSVFIAAFYKKMCHLTSWNLEHR